MSDEKNTFSFKPLTSEEVPKSIIKLHYSSKNV